MIRDVRGRIIRAATGMICGVFLGLFTALIGGQFLGGVDMADRPDELRPWVIAGAVLGAGFGGVAGGVAIGEPWRTRIQAALIGAFVGLFVGAGVFQGKMGAMILLTTPAGALAGLIVGYGRSPSSPAVSKPISPPPADLWDRDLDA
jgi:hypothetical protein